VYRPEQAEAYYLDIDHRKEGDKGRLLIMKIRANGPPRLNQGKD